MSASPRRSPRKPRKSLVNGETRKDRYKREQMLNERENIDEELGVVGRKTGIRLKPVSKDSLGFDDMEKLFAPSPGAPLLNRESRDDKENANNENLVTDVEMVHDSAKDNTNVNNNDTGGLNLINEINISENSEEISNVSVSTPTKDSDAVNMSKSPEISSNLSPIPNNDDHDFDENMENKILEKRSEKDEMENNNTVIEGVESNTNDNGEQQALINESKSNSNEILPENINNDDKTNHNMEKDLADEKQENLESPAKILPNSDINETETSRRPKRERFPVLKWWEGERVVSEKDSEGDSKIKGILKKKVNNENDTVNKKKVEEKKVSKSNKKRKKKDDDIEKEEVEKELFEPNCIVFDSCSKTEVLATVAKSQSMVIMENLYQIENDNKKKNSIPKGGKMFEENSFSSGLLELPPKGLKNKETANTTEIFYVIGTEVNCLRLKLHKTEKLLSAGDSFTIPAGNQYTLQNLSKTSSVNLYFVLLKHA